jgi:hypothetical protein
MGSKIQLNSVWFWNGWKVKLHKISTALMLCFTFKRGDVSLESYVKLKLFYFSKRTYKKNISLFVTFQIF